MFLTSVPMKRPVFLTGGTLASLCNIDLKRLCLEKVNTSSFYFK